MSEIEPKPKKYKYTSKYTEVVAPEIMAAAKADYLTGQFHSESLAQKHGLKRRSMWWNIRFNKWGKELEDLGLTQPEEPEFARPNAKPPEVWAAAEADFMRGMKPLEIGKKHGIHPAIVDRKAKKLRWKSRREQLIEANRVRIAGSVQARMAHFEELSGKFLQAASLKLEQLLGEVSRASVSPTELEKLIKMHSMLYEAVKKMPQMNKPSSQTESKGVPENSIPPAHRPAPVLSVSEG